MAGERRRRLRALGQADEYKKRPLGIRIRRHCGGGLRDHVPGITVGPTWMLASRKRACFLRRTKTHRSLRLKRKRPLTART